MNQNQVKKEVLNYLASSTACLDTEILQWAGLTGILGWFKDFFAETQICQSVLNEFCQNPYDLKKPEFIKVFPDRWVSYPYGYILEPDGTLIAKLLSGKEREFWCPLSALSDGSTSSNERLVMIGSISSIILPIISPKSGDTTIKLSKGLYVYDSSKGWVYKAAFSTMQDGGDCGFVEHMDKLDQPKIGFTSDSKLRKNLERNQYLYTGFEGFLELSVARGLCSESDADDIHRIICNSGARLYTTDWYKWHKKDALEQTWLRLYKRIKEH